MFLYKLKAEYSESDVQKEETSWFTVTQALTENLYYPTVDLIQLNLLKPSMPVGGWIVYPKS